MTFRVQRKACATCIYRKDSPLDLKKLENDVRDSYGGFKGTPHLPSQQDCLLPWLLEPAQERIHGGAVGAASGVR